VLATVPLGASVDEIRAIADVQARMLSAPELEAAAAAAVAADVLGHPLLQRAGRARTCLREVPVSLVRDGVLIDGQADLAFEDEHGWVVVDFKTDAELGPGEDAYRRQVALYVEGIVEATGRPARGVLLRL
jgi:ATP-dependent exoDNAse (exonuclease V) beta subunit